MLNRSVLNLTSYYLQWFFLLYMILTPSTLLHQLKILVMIKYQSNLLSYAGPISVLINQSMVSGKFPATWKKADICPVQKKPDDMSLSNFRPIPVLPILSKLLERVVYDQLYAHLIDIDLFSNKQAGFRPNHST